MAQQDEISSTERLLDLIRNKDQKEPEPSDSGHSHSFAVGISSSIKKVIPFKKKTVVGVDIGRNTLKLVAINQSTEKKMELLDYSIVPFEADLNKDSPQFSRFLKSALTAFCGSARAVEIWSAISSANVETRYVKIPKVPSKQIYNAVYWTYKKEVSFNEKTDLFDFDILGEITDNGVRRIEVICYSAPIQEIQDLRNIFERSGYPLTGISIVPFAVQNLLRTQWLDPEVKNLCNLFIGKDWSRIAVFSEGNLVLSRDIKAGIISMIEAIREVVDQHTEGGTGRPAAGDLTPAGESSLEKATGPDDNLSSKLFHLLVQNPTETLVAFEGVTYQKEEIFQIIQPALERVVRQVERTIEHYNLHYTRDSVGKIFVSGQVCTNREIVEYIGKQLDLPIEVIDPFKTNPSFLENVAVPQATGDRGSLVPAIGMALSDNSITPNFIYTHKEKQQLATTLLFNRAAFGILVLLLTLCVGINYWQGHLIKLKKGIQKQLQRQVDSSIPYVDQNLIIQMVAQKQQNIATLNKIGRRYMGAAVISEVARMTPENVKLLNLTLELGGVEDPKASDKKTADKNVKKMLTLEGVILGDRLTFEASLASYLVNLKKSPIVSQAKIQRQAVELFENTEALRFTAQLELGVI
ncbi:MAG: pilus assembly protein PilM [Thermodesulfobacteriota bacterium]